MYLTADFAGILLAVGSFHLQNLSSFLESLLPVSHRLNSKQEIINLPILTWVILKWVQNKLQKLFLLCLCTAVPVNQTRTDIKVTWTLYVHNN